MTLGKNALWSPAYSWLRVERLHRSGLQPTTYLTGFGVRKGQSTMGLEQTVRGYWTASKVALTALGGVVALDADNEGTILFQPENEALTQAVIKAGKISRKRTRNLTPEQKQTLRDRLAQSRKRKSL